VAIISYDEKPGIQAIATTAPDLPPERGVHATFAREHEYKRHGTISLLAGIDLVTGKVHALRLTYQSGPHLSSRCVQNCTFGPASSAVSSIVTLGTQASGNVAYQGARPCLDFVFLLPLPRWRRA
jgi:hypothetical protein